MPQVKLPASWVPVAFVLDEGRPVVEVARNIDVHEMSLRKWVKKERDAREEALGPDTTLSESERAELQRLRDENKTVKAENAQLQMQVSFANYADVPVMPMFV